MGSGNATEGCATTWGSPWDGGWFGPGVMGHSDGDGSSSDGSLDAPGDWEGYGVWDDNGRGGGGGTFGTCESSGGATGGGVERSSSNDAAGSPPGGWS